MPIVRAAAVAIFATASLATPAQTPVRYAPGTQHYRLHSVVKRSQEMQGQKTEFEITTDQQVSVALAAGRAKDTLQFTYTLDSAKLVSNLPVQLPDVSKMQGTRVVGAMSPNGTVYSYQADPAADSDADRKAVTESMARFLVAVPTTAKIGSTWADTSSSTISREGSDLKTTTITSSRLVGDTTYNGQKAWRIERKSVLSLSGSQSQGDQQLSVVGEGTGNGMYYVSTKGAYLGSTATQNMTMTITIPASGLSVPVQQTATSSVALIP